MGTILTPEQVQQIRNNFQRLQEGEIEQLVDAMTTTVVPAIVKRHFDIYDMLIDTIKDRERQIEQLKNGEETNGESRPN